MPSIYGARLTTFEDSEKESEYGYVRKDKRSAIVRAQMDKASIIKDAIDYIQELHEQERRIQADLIQLESGKLKKNAVFDLDQEIPTLSRLKKKRIDHSYDSRRSTTSSIEDLELSVSYIGEKTVVVSLTCSKRTETMVKLCEVFETLKLKIIAANITCFSGRVLKTVFVQIFLM